MYWVSDSMRPVRVTLRMIALVLAGCGMVPSSKAQSDTLSLREKQTINALAEGRLKDYVWMLKYIAELTDSDDDALAGADYIKDAIEGDIRVFYNAGTVIEDNVDPALGPGSKGLERKADEYLKELRLHFKKEAEAVDHKLAMRGEPKAGPIISTSLLYEVQLKGTHTDRPGIPYKRHKRIMGLIAERRGEGKWNVLIASDLYYDSTKTFVQFRVDKALDQAKATGAAETPELAAYRESERQAQALVDAEKAERMKAYEQAIQKGQDAVAAGDFDIGIALYAEARKHDPLAIDPLILTKKAENARIIKQQNDKRMFDALQDQGRKLTEMREYQRALDSYQSAAVIFPEDQRSRPVIDSLQAKVRAKAERERFFETPDYPGSVAECQRLLKDPAHKDDVEVKTLLARSLAKMGGKKREDALRVLNEVIVKEPHFGEALRTRADIQEGNGVAGLNSAMQDYSVLKTFDQWDMRNYHRYAMLLCLTAKRCTEAQQALRDALKFEPGNKKTMYLLARVNSVDGMKDYPVAVQYLADALHADSLCAECWLERGIVLLQMDSVAAAEQAISRARRLSMEPWCAARADSMAAFNLKQAQSLEISQGFEDADRSYLRACVLDPTDPALRFKKAKNLMQMQKWAAAIKDLDIHIANTAGPFQALLDRANCKLKLGQYAESRADVAGILSNHIEKYSAYANLVAGQAAYLMEDYPAAEAHLKEALRLDLPDNPDTEPKDKDNRSKNAKASRFMALICMKSNRRKDAKDYAKDAVDLEPKDKENHMNLGLALQADGDRNGSVASFEEAFRLGADKSEVCKLTGRSYMLAEDWKQALVHFGEQKPLKDDKDVFFWTAECQQQLEQYPLALGELNQVLSKFPEVETQPEFLARIGYLYVITGNNNVAKEYFEKAIGIDNLHKTTLLYRSTYLWKNDQQTEAVKQLGELVDRGIILESEMKNRPILEDILDSKLWKSRAGK